MRRVTSQPLGTLPPGYAATKRGYAVYAGLVGALGLIALGVGYANVWLIIGSIALFIIETVVAILGEIATFRNLSRGPGEPQASRKAGPPGSGGKTR